MTMPLIALLTDFGNKDGFAGVMKGVIYSLIQTPNLNIVDISHEVEPQNINQGRWILENSYEHFPPHTVFVCVVDPKVGDEQQKHLLAYWEERQQFFIAPDNGLISPVADRATFPFRVYQIENESLFYKAAHSADSVSQTFHGRDIYAPVAAYLVNALEQGTLEPFLESVGHQTGDFIRLKPTEATRQHLETGSVIEGVIEHIDTFGNLMTNIPNDWLSTGHVVDIQIIHHQWRSQKLASYIQGEGEDQVFLVPGSGGSLELCLYGKSAKKALEVNVADQVSIQLDKDTSMVSKA